MFMGVSCTLHPACLSPRDTTRAPSIPVGMLGLRHKLRHKKSERPQGMVELSAPVRQNHGDTSGATEGHF